MLKLRESIAAKLALGYGVLVAASITLVSGIFYVETIGVLDNAIDKKIASISDRLTDFYQHGSIESLSREINQELTDGVDSDTEIFLVASATNQRIVGNLSTWPDADTPKDQLILRDVTRDGKTVPARLIVRVLPGGDRLIVGRNLTELESIRYLVGHALFIGIGISLFLALSGAVVFRWQLEQRIGRIRRTAREIETGDLTRRMPVIGKDEFSLLNRDINRMLDRIEHLMEGVRHVSNAIAHDLRTPLNRIRSKLDHALHHGKTVDTLAEASYAAIEDIDELILVFEKLLQIAEAESGMRAKSFEKVDLALIVDDMVELYDAAAEERQVSLKKASRHSVFIAGDHNLLGNALASLIDNAIKYAGSGATIEVSVGSDSRSAFIRVRDDGPGVPIEELPKVTQRFYRLDKSRNLPGNGLGLSIVSAIATLHGGALRLENASPGLMACIILPCSKSVG